MLEPVLNSDLITELVWQDEFDGDLSKWDQDEFIRGDSPHRTGNQYIQPDGSIDLDQPWSKLPGRWAALYDNHRKECQYTEDGNLVMKGHVVKTMNPYRDNFTDNAGVIHPYGDNMVYASWLQADATITPGSVVEVCVSAEEMCMRGHRWSIWLMPKNGKAYLDTVANCEIDCPEIEYGLRVKNNTFADKALLKIVGGLAGDTVPDRASFSEHGIDIRSGYHTFTTVYNYDGSLEFYCDGILMNRDDRSVTMDAILLITREMNSGVKNLPSAKLAALNKRVGLDGVSEIVTITDLNHYIDSQNMMIGVARGLVEDAKGLTPDGFEQFSDDLMLEGDLRISDESSRENYISRTMAEIVSIGGDVEAARDVPNSWENYTTGPKTPEDSGLTAQSVGLDFDLIDKDKVRVKYVRIFKIKEGDEEKTIDPIDVDLGDLVSLDGLTIDEKIAILAGQYERAEAKIAEQAEYINALVDSTRSANELADAKAAELATYREQTTATISALSQVENELRAEIDALKKKPIPTPNPTPVVVAPPVSKESEDRLNALLRIAGRG